MVSLLVAVWVVSLLVAVWLYRDGIALRISVHATEEAKVSNASWGDRSHSSGSPRRTRRLGVLPRPILRKEKLEKFLVVPEHKLLFCYMEKVGCKQFSTLFRNLRYPDAYKLRKYKNVWTVNAAPRLGYTKKDLEHMLADPTWHKAVFFREPLERFLSAYKSKCEMHDGDGEKHCTQQFGEFPIKFPDAAKSVAHRVEKGSAHLETMNRHWVPQWKFCGGLGNTLQYYDTVEKLDRETSREKVVKLLRKVGVDPKTIPEFDSLYPVPGSKTAVSAHSHATGSVNDFYDYFGNVPLTVIKNLTEFYRADYKLFNMTVPDLSPLR